MVDIHSEYGKNILQAQKPRMKEILDSYLPFRKFSKHVKFFDYNLIRPRIAFFDMLYIKLFPDFPFSDNGI